MYQQPISRSLAALDLRVSPAFESSPHGLEQSVAVHSVTPPSLKRCGASLPDLRELAKRRPAITDVEPLYQLLGRDRARDLDVRFGSVQPPLVVPEKPKRKPIKDWERDSNGDVIAHPRRITVAGPQGVHPNLLQDPKLSALLNEEKNYIWSVAAMGTLYLGEEIRLGGFTAKGKPKLLGHPVLVSGRPARLGGELAYSKQHKVFTLNPFSGRQSRYNDRSLEQLINVAAIFEQAGLVPLTIDAQSRNAYKPYDLVMPSLALSESQTAISSHFKQNL